MKKILALEKKEQEEQEKKYSSKLQVLSSRSAFPVFQSLRLLLPAPQYAPFLVGKPVGHAYTAFHPPAA